SWPRESRSAQRENCPAVNPGCLYHPVVTKTFISQAPRKREAGSGEREARSGKSEECGVKREARSGKREAISPCSLLPAPHSSIPQFLNWAIPESVFKGLL